ncbi:hypothetical protein [Sulfuricurvum sp.]|uniref:hypothetical protein n=1 Tax=Sulfuricurvum sp. TaxID=2025608 RepID=UPI0025CEC6FD|nr:hypothetical protein [Sulfuricurvum sp.]
MINEELNLKKDITKNEYLNEIKTFLKNHYVKLISASSTLVFTFLLTILYFNSIPANMIFVNTNNFLLFTALFLILIAFLFFIILSLFLLQILYALIQFYRQKITIKNLSDRLIGILFTVFLVAIIYVAWLSPTFVPKLYLEVLNYPKVFQNSNGHYYTIFSHTDNVYEGYDLNKSLISSNRCQEIEDTNITLPVDLMFLLIKKQPDDSYTIPYNITRIDDNLTLVEFNQALSAIKILCISQKKKTNQ